MKITARAKSPAIVRALGALFFTATLVTTGCVRQEKPEANPDIDLTELKEIFNTPIPAPQQMDLNVVEIRVNDTEITRGDIMQQANIVAATQGRGLSKEQLMQNRARIIAQARDNLILQALLTKAVEDENVAITGEEWDAKLKEIKAAIPEETTLEAELEKSNVEFEQFKTSQEQRMKLEKLINSKVPEIADPTEEEAKAYYDGNPAQFKFPESVTFKMISMNPGPADDEEARKKKLDFAEILRKELIDGASMDEKITAHSEHPNKEQGGKARIYKGSTGIQELETILFGLKMGNYSDVIVLPNSYVIYQAIEAHAAGTTPFADVKDRVINGMKQKKQQDAVNTYIKDLREKANIEFVGQPVSEGAPEGTDKPADAGAGAPPAGAGAAAPAKSDQ